MLKEKLTVLKIGGKVIDDSQELSEILKIFSSIRNKKILIHGGGKKVDQVLSQFGIQKQYIQGRRVTDQNTLDVVTMVLSGLVNKQIVALLQSQNINSIGLSGADLNLIQCQKRKTESVDFGFVGDIQSVNAKQCVEFLKADIVPVICPITHDHKGQLLNTNADTIAQAVAGSVAKLDQYQVELIYCFELDGVYEDLSKPETHITYLNKNQYQQYRSANMVKDGMLPKLENCFSALLSGVNSVIISNVEQIKRQLQGQKSRVTKVYL